MDVSLIDKHLEKLSAQELKEKYGELLPPSMSNNPSKADIIDVVRSGFFQQSEQKLSESLRNGKGAGYLLAQTLKYDYKGEGVDLFLQGIRELGKKEKDDEQTK